MFVQEVIAAITMLPSVSSHRLAVVKRDARDPGLVFRLRNRYGDAALGKLAARVARPPGSTGGCRMHRQAEPLGQEAGQIAAECAGEIAERDPVLGPPRSGDRRHDASQVELERHRVLRVGRIVSPEERHGLRRALDALHDRGTSAGALEITERLIVDREEPDRRSVFRGHVRQRGPVRERECREPRTAELDEPSHHALGPEHLRHTENEVGGRRTLREGAGHAHPHDLGEKHVVGLAEEHGLRLDAAHTPADDAEAVDHRRVGVRSDDRVREDERHAVLLAAVHHAREVLEVDLVNDPGARGHDLEVREGVLGPAEELVALAVPLVLALHIPAV